MTPSPIAPGRATDPPRRPAPPRNAASTPCVFRYPGGKSKCAARRWILAHRPKVVREYREPFVGGGGVFFGLAGVQNCWLNDLDPDLVAVYRALRDRPGEFIAACRAVEPACPDDPLSAPGPKGGVGVNARLKAVYDRLAADPGADPAFRFYYLSRTGFAGRVRYDLPSRLRFSNPAGWNVVATDVLEKAAAKLAGVRLSCGSYEPLLEDPGADVWAFLDPPYSADADRPPTRRLYRYGFSRDAWRRFAGAVKRSPHRACVCHADDEFVRSLFTRADGFRVIEGEWAYGGTTRAEKARGRELLILNYTPGRVVVPVTAAPPAAGPGKPPAWRAGLRRALAAVPPADRSAARLFLLEAAESMTPAGRAAAGGGKARRRASG